MDIFGIDAVLTITDARQWVTLANEQHTRHASGGLWGLSCFGISDLYLYQVSRLFPAEATGAQTTRGSTARPSGRDFYQAPCP